MQRWRSVYNDIEAKLHAVFKLKEKQALAIVSSHSVNHFSLV